MPGIPRLLWDAGIRDTIFASYVVAIDGTVDSVRVVGTEYPTYREAIAKAVSNSRFEPAMRGGEPVAVRREEVFEIQSPSGTLHRCGIIRSDPLNATCREIRFWVH